MSPFVLSSRRRSRFVLKCPLVRYAAVLFVVWSRNAPRRKDTNNNGRVGEKHSIYNLIDVLKIEELADGPNALRWLGLMAHASVRQGAGIAAQKYPQYLSVAVACISRGSQTPGSERATDRGNFSRFLTTAPSKIH